MALWEKTSRIVIPAAKVAKILTGPEGQARQHEAFDGAASIDACELELGGRWPASTSWHFISAVAISTSGGRG
jgi:hypothetical protein